MIFEIPILVERRKDGDRARRVRQALVRPGHIVGPLPGDQPLRGATERPRASGGLQRFAVTLELEQRAGLRVVITSYSIHYTKLYETFC